ncbi:MAG: hypothetical protein ABIT58_02035 [Ferruginibacter sp.]
MSKNLHKASFINFTRYLLILPLLISLYGCPFRSAYKLDNEPNVSVDESLVGKWSSTASKFDGTQFPVKMIVTKKNDYEYDLSFIGPLKNALHSYNPVKEDTINATAFISEAASRRFLNIRAMSQFYIAEFIYKNDKLTLLPLCEHFTSRLVKSDTELKQMLELHYKTRLYPLYDDEFSLKQMTRVD